MAKNKITDIARELLGDYLKEEGMEVYHVEYVKEGPDRVLRVYIDKDEGFIGTEDCEKVSRFLSDKLDEADPIEENYLLEVSSPGMDRVLWTEEHFRKYVGEEIEVSLYKELEGSKNLTGTLLSYSDGDIVIRVDGDIEIRVNGADEKSGAMELRIAKDMIAKANLAVIL